MQANEVLRVVYKELFEQEISSLKMDRYCNAVLDAPIGHMVGEACVLYQEKLRVSGLPYAVVIPTRTGGKWLVYCMG